MQLLSPSQTGKTILMLQLFSVMKKMNFRHPVLFLGKPISVASCKKDSGCLLTEKCVPIESKLPRPTTPIETKADRTFSSNSNVFQRKRGRQFRCTSFSCLLWTI